MNQLSKRLAARARAGLRRGLLACWILLVATPAVRAGNLWVAGTNLYGTYAAPVGDGGAVAVSASRDHVLALRADGTLLGWGYEGDKHTQPPAGLSNVVAVAAGMLHNLALKSDGTVVAWGFDGAGMTRVPAGLGGVVAVAAGDFHSLALTRGGRVVGWGYGGGGRTSPPSWLSGVVAIAAGRDHSLALKGDGTVVGWGQNDTGQASPPPGLGNVTAIAAGSSHNLALKSDGRVVAWGSNGQGESAVPAGLSGVVGVAAGNDFSLALRSDGTVVGWGGNEAGQLNLPAGGVVAIAAGGWQSVAVTSDASVTFGGEPRSVSIPAGSSALFAFEVSGGAPSGYQWYFNGQPMPGGTSSNLVLTFPGLGRAGTYQVSATFGGATVWSTPAVLQLAGGLSIASMSRQGDGSVDLLAGGFGGEPLVESDLTGWSLQSSSDLFVWADLGAPGSLSVGQWLLRAPPDPSPTRFFRLRQAP